MNAIDMLQYGHQAVLEAVHDWPATEWETPGVCGEWSVKDIIAHLTAFEHVLDEVLSSLLIEGFPTPTLDHFQQEFQNFNDNEVALRRHLSPQVVLAEYKTAQAQTQALMERLPAEVPQQNGALVWYGVEYDLEDFIVHTIYGHKREHSAQIATFRDRLTRTLFYWLEGNLAGVAVA